MTSLDESIYVTDITYKHHGRRGVDLIPSPGKGTRGHVVLHNLNAIFVLERDARYFVKGNNVPHPYKPNDAPADIVLPMEPCNEDFAQPNVMMDVENYLPYVIYPQNSVQSIYVEIVFDDGTTDFARFERSAIRIP